MDEEIRKKLEHKKCVYCMKMYTDFVDKQGNRICTDCDRRKKREVQILRSRFPELYFNRC